MTAIIQLEEPSYLDEGDTLLIHRSHESYRVLTNAFKTFLDIV
jgi:hypothetical protein